jgi:hypothetical protein
MGGSDSLPRCCHPNSGQQCLLFVHALRCATIRHLRRFNHYQRPFSDLGTSRTTQKRTSLAGRFCSQPFPHDHLKRGIRLRRLMACGTCGHDRALPGPRPQTCGAAPTFQSKPPRFPASLCWSAPDVRFTKSAHRNPVLSASTQQLWQLGDLLRVCLFRAATTAPVALWPHEQHCRQQPAGLRPTKSQCIAAQ